MGLPGDLPQGFGGFAGLPNRPKSVETTLCTRVGVSLPTSWRLSLGSLISATLAHASLRELRESCNHQPPPSIGLLRG